MPNKIWSNLKDPVDRQAAGEWADALEIPDLTSNEWARAGDLASSGKSHSEIQEEILDRRKK